MNILSTNRLVIRPFAMTDLPAAHQLLDHDIRWSGSGITLEQRRERLQREVNLAQWADTDNLFGYRAIVLKATQELIGICGFLPILHTAQQQRLFWPQLFGEVEPPHDYAALDLEIGYALGNQHRQQGYAVEALFALLEYGFGELQIKQLFAATNRSNAGSIALMQRVGMRIAHNPERLDEDWPDGPGVMGVIENYLTRPTPYAQINAVVHRLWTSVRRALGAHFVGLYLYGSLASGDFNLETSDIDFLVVTAAELPPEQIERLAQMHQRLWDTGLPWTHKLEGSYLPQAALRRYDPKAPPCPQVNEGRFYLAQQGEDWIIQRYILREQGIVVDGPALLPLIDPVQPAELRQAVLGFLHGWWEPMLANPIRLQSSEYQAYAVLTMCRALHTLIHGTIASKPAAAHWAQAYLGEPWRNVIAEALVWRSDQSFDHFEAVLILIRLTIDQGNQSNDTYERSNQKTPR